MCTIHIVGDNKTNYEVSEKMIVGRGPVFGISDKKVSRNHAIITPINDVEEFKLELKATHINPCFIKKLGKEKSKVLEKDEKSILENGDIFSLLSDKHSFTVKIGSNKVKHLNENQNHSLNSNINTTELKTKKESQNDENSPEKTPIKNISDITDEKVENISNISSNIENQSESKEEQKDNTLNTSKPTREQCVWGKRCYRRNPAHFKDYSHPGDSDFESDSENKNEKFCPYGSGCFRNNPAHK